MGMDVVAEEGGSDLERIRTNTGDEVSLRFSAGRYEIRFNGWELMSDRAHWSEAALGRWGCEAIRSATPFVLVGGLGIGYTLRAALDALPGSAQVIVAELVPEVIAWNRSLLKDSAGRPLEDARVRLEPYDVTAVLRNSPRPFDAVLLDVDNGPDDITFDGNREIYSADGLALIRRALTRHGRLAVWSARRSQHFEAQLACSGFLWKSVEVPARGTEGDPSHTIYLADATGN